LAITHCAVALATPLACSHVATVATGTQSAFSSTDQFVKATGAGFANAAASPFCQ
jgi:hypothetical protein